LRFVDVEAGVVTEQELRQSMFFDPNKLPALSPPSVLVDPTSPTQPDPSKDIGAKVGLKSEAYASSSSDPIYKIILLGTTGVGKSSILAVGVNGDEAYVVRYVIHGAF
jgi:hypothetical protein